MKNVSRLLPLLSGIVTLSGCNHAPQKNNGQNSQKPNIIYIFADDLGIGDLSCYGATKVSTPNIDRLAGQGVQFTNAYATSATSTPSRFGLLTGMYPWRQENTGIAPGNSELIIDTTCVTMADMLKDAGYATGAVGKWHTGMYPWRQENTGIAPGNSELIIDTTCVTMADMLKDAGYATGAVGKWHLGLGPKGGTDFNNRITPNAQSIGFDYEFIIPATVDRVPCVFVENGHVVGLDPNDPITVNYDHKVGDWPTGEENPELVTLKPSQGHNNTIINGIPRIGWMTGGKSALWKDEDIADIITNKAKNFIASHQEEPFFLYMGTQDVHVPRIPHPRFAGKSGLGTRGDVILQLDWTIGEIMHTLDSLHIADNTILIFTSDNGPVIDDGYQDQAYELLNGHTPMGIYRGGKYSAYEAGTRVPFIVRWPARVKPNKQQALFSQIDVYASLASLLEQPVRKGAAPDSQEHLNVLLGKNNTNREYVVQQNLNNTLAIIKGQWKYIEPSDGPLHIADNTILIFTSDNGPVIDDGYQDQAYELLNGHTPMGIYRGGKYSAYEAGTRVPFIVRWPARVKPNKQQALFSQIDVYASLASLLDQPLRKGAAPDSQEHLNVLLGKNNTNREYVVQQNLNNTLAIIKGQWKYIEPSDGPAIEYWTKMELGNDKQPQLYDLSSDPSEKTNVSKQYPDIVKELSELLESVKEK